MGSLNYYRRFLPYLSLTMKAFSQLLKKDIFEWTEVQEKAFIFVKDILEKNLVVSHAKPGEKLYLCVD